MSHTPGPWFVLEREREPLIVNTGDDPGDTHICTVTGAASNPSSQADAHLIAAAPDLLSALKWLLEHHVEWIKADGFNEQIVNASRAAIAKAEGQ